MQNYEIGNKLQEALKKRIGKTQEQTERSASGETSEEENKKNKKKERINVEGDVRGKEVEINKE